MYEASMPVFVFRRSKVRKTDRYDVPLLAEVIMAPRVFGGQAYELCFCSKLSYVCHRYDSFTSPASKSINKLKGTTPYTSTAERSASMYTQKHIARRARTPKLQYQTEAMYNQPNSAYSLRLDVLKM